MTESDDISDAWNGTSNNGNKCPDGSYFYIYSGYAENSEFNNGQVSIQLINSQ